MNNNLNETNIDEGSTLLKHQPLSELVADQIMDWIMDGRLRVGEKINSDSLAKLLGVSRTPVREAIKLLEKTGLISSTPYAGTHVNKLLIKEIEEIYTIRKLLETFIVKLTVLYVTDSDIVVLEQMQDKIESIADSTSRDNKLLYKLNKDFHMRMYSIANMPHTCEMIDSLWANLSFFRLVLANNQSYGKKVKLEHREYIEALRNKDAQWLEQLVLSNLSSHAAEMPNLVKQYYISIGINDY